MGELPADVSAAWEWPHGVTFHPSTDGLINQTWLARQDGDLVGVVQRLNTQVFVPEVHEDMHAVTQHVRAKGLTTPHLVPTRNGALWFTSEHGVYRRLTPVGDDTVHALSSPAQAASAGAMVGRFHHALSDFHWEFRSVRPGAHDTRLHIERMQAAVAAHATHRLVGDVGPLADGIVAHWRSWQGSLEQPQRIIHGDLKVSNLRWSGGKAVAIIDLDTLQVGSLAVELGDAFRSWCNPRPEHANDARFDVELFTAAMGGYLAHAQPTAQEREAVVPGVDRIATELAARFARDALEEAYFGFDPAYGGRGEHNLMRAQAQLALARSVREQQAQAQRALDGLTSRA